MQLWRSGKPYELDKRTPYHWGSDLTRDNSACCQCSRGAGHTLLEVWKASR